MEQEGQLSLDGMPDEGPVADLITLTTQLRDLTTFCRHQVDIIARRSGMNVQDESFLFAQAVKLGEEVGELHAEILGLRKLQRGDKVTSDRGSIAGELADVAICVGIIAEVVGVNLGSALASKIDHINQRTQAQHQRSSDAGLEPPERWSRSRG